MNIDKLKGKMREKNKTQEDLSKALNLSLKTINSRLNQGIFKTNEIDLITHLLCLSKDEALEIFFNPKVS